MRNSPNSANKVRLLKTVYFQKSYTIARLSSATRHKVVILHQQGLSQAEISRQTGVSRCAVQALLRKYKEQPNDLFGCEKCVLGYIGLPNMFILSTLEEGECCQLPNHL